MELKIRITGTASLKEVYQDPKDKRHYAVLSTTTQAEGVESYAPTEVKFEVPITAEQHRRLKYQLEQSEAEKPVLRVNGDLELILGSISIS